MAITLPDIQQLNEFNPAAVQPRVQEGLAQAATVQNPGIVGAAISQAGEQTRTAVDKLQDLQNETTARNASNKFMDAATTIDTQFRQEPNMGAAMPAYQQKYRDLQTQLSQNMPAEAQKQFLNDSQGYMSFVHRQMAETSAQQFTNNITQTNETAAQLALQNIQRNPNDPNWVQNNKNAYIAAKVALVKNHGGDETAQANEAQIQENDINKAIAGAWLGAKPVAQQAQLLNAGIPKDGQPADLGADYVKPYTMQQVTEYRDLATKPSQYDALFTAAAQKYAAQAGVDAQTLFQEAKLHAAVESSMNPNAKNDQSQGIMGISNGNIASLKVANPLDPAQNIDAGVKILAQNMSAVQPGDTHSADLMYYGGSDKAQWGKNTQQYAENLAAIRGNPTGDLSAAPANTGTPVDNLTISERAQMLTKLRGETAAQTTQDKNDIMRAVDGEFTKGQPPANYSELSNIPQVKDALGRVAQNDPKFYETLDTIVARMAKKNVTTNSPNAYDALMVATDTDGGFTREQKIDHLSMRLGSTNAGISITGKDFNDAKPALDWDSDNTTGKNIKSVHDKMIEIANMGGNIDGQGQQRAVGYFNEVSKAIKDNAALGDKRDKIENVISKINNEYAPPSTMKQWWNKLVSSEPVTSPSTPGIQINSGINQLGNISKSVGIENIPAGAIAKLRAHPETASDFKEKFGVEPQQYLGK